LRSKSIYFLYRVLQAAAFPLVCLYFLLRCRRNPKYLGTMAERLGFLPREYQQTVAGAIWFHAVSVGEVMAISGLVERARAQFPFAPVFVSSTTLAGHATAREKLDAHVFYAPIDYCFAVRHVLRTIRPAMLVVAETEIWPNLFREAVRAGCGLIIVNGRISDAMADRYATWRWFFRAALEHPQQILTQGEEHRARFIDAGAPPDGVHVFGNLKYDFTPRDSSHLIRDFTAGAKVWIAASTSADEWVAEEDLVLKAFAHMPGWKLIIAPRKPHRFDEVAEKLEKAGFPFGRWSRRELNGEVLLLDTIGDLNGLFPAADVVFMGGTLAQGGGHNILEPAFFARPIVVGPHMENFREIADDFRAANAFVELRSHAELLDGVTSAAEDTRMGIRAKACADAKRGAVDRTMAAMTVVYADAVPRFRRSLPGLLWLWPFSLLWRLFRRRPVRHPESLNARVISVGNITAGGTGKTPLVIYLAQKLRDRGRQPGILTRGHGRNSHHNQLLLDPGATASVLHTGDETQLFLRSGLAPVGIGKDRVSTGRQLEEKYQLDTLILDDGFQQVKLARDLDIVMIDAMTPFGEEELLPLGRLREPLDSLSRASAFVITRAEFDQPLTGLERRIRQYNLHAPIFRLRTRPDQWVNEATAESFPATGPPFQKMLAFCGLGNPHAFWRTLDQLGIKPVERIEFSDHHRYTPGETRRFGLLVRGQGIQALLTTQKDLVNLCESTEATVAPAQVLWLRIDVEIDREEEFLKLVFGD
jgi:3-deoxy-D-manno-octulosonic-acid transferase